MSKHTEKLNLYEIEKEHDTFSTFDIDTILNDNWERIDENVINKHGTVPFIAEQIGVDPISEQGLATKHYVDTHTTVMLGETETTAYRGDRGKIAYDHSQAIGNPHNTTKADIELGNVKNVDTTTTVNISDSADKRFITDAKKTVLDNISGVNTGDETQASIISKLGATPADNNLSNLTASAKTNLNAAGIRTVVETSVNGASWYRVWSDGWIEQGGIIASLSSSSLRTISFSRAFSNTNYNLQVTIESSYAGALWGEYLGFYSNSKTTSGFQIYDNGTPYITGYNWKACGY